MSILSRAGNGLKSLSEQEVVDCNQDGKVNGNVLISFHFCMSAFSFLIN